MLCALLSPGNAQPIAAQDEALLGHPWWMNALSFTFSVLAVSCAAIAVVELAVNPKIFWMAQVLAGAFLATGFAMAKVGTVFFWIAVLAALTMATVIVALLLVRTVAKWVVR
ncbi:MAG: hypothetical protein QMD00_00985 [Hadesarchaea archaeon]|nr:hypothetical protein [Hadesarchaea archaeon]